MKDIDCFFTPDNVARECISDLFSTLNITQDENFLEPSAGNGSFSHILTNCLAYDINPKGNNIIKADFLKTNLERTDYITIGNPPFGKKSKLAIDFFNHASNYSNVVAFIVPNQFTKWSVQSKLNPLFKLVKETTLDTDHFLYNGEETRMGIRCVFQIWVREGSKYDKLEDLRIREKPPTSLSDCKLWQHNGTKQSMKTVDEDWEYAVYRQGYKDYNKLFKKSEKGYIKERMNTTTEQFFFMKPLTDDARTVIENLDFDRLAKRNTTTPGFGKADFIKFYNEERSKYVRK